MMLEPILPVAYGRSNEMAAFRVELLRHWCVETSFWPEAWTPGRPSLGQCAVTAMIVQDRFGGEIVRSVNEGMVHYWNRVDGFDVDLTRDQFDVWAPKDETAITRAELASSGPTIAARYRRLVDVIDD